MGMTRAIVDQKLSALLSAEARLHHALERSLECGAYVDAYRKAEDEYNEAFDAWWWAGAVQSRREISGMSLRGNRAIATASTRTMGPAP